MIKIFYVSRYSSDQNERKLKSWVFKEKNHPKSAQDAINRLKGRKWSNVNG